MRIVSMRTAKGYLPKAPYLCILVSNARQNLGTNIIRHKEGKSEIERTKSSDPNSSRLSADRKMRLYKFRSHMMAESCGERLDTGF